MHSPPSADPRLAGLPALPPFPACAVPETPAALRQRGIVLRPCTSTDLPFLRDLYHQLRAGELAPLPWPETQKQAFLDSQFALQHRHYLTQYPDAAYCLVESAAQPIGRLYLWRQAPQFLVIDISLMPQWRNGGIGTALMRGAQDLARRDQAALDLHVDQRNGAARRLYERLGFIATDEEGPYAGMRWQPPQG